MDELYPCVCVFVCVWLDLCLHSVPRLLKKLCKPVKAQNVLIDPSLRSAASLCSTSPPFLSFSSFVFMCKWFIIKKKHTVLAKHANHKSFLSPLFLLAFYLCCSKSLSPISPSWHTSRFILLLLLLLISFPLFLLLLSSPLSPSHSLALLMILSVPQCHREKNFGSCKNIFVFLAQKLSSAFFFFPPSPCCGSLIRVFQAKFTKVCHLLKVFPWDKCHLHMWVCTLVRFKHLQN